MARVGLTAEQLLVATWSSPVPLRYAAHVPGLDVLRGETLALVGSDVESLVQQVAGELGDCLPLDGPACAAAGTLRIHAQQAARVGLRAVSVSDPFAVATLGGAARALAVADLAGFASLGVTSVVVCSDVGLAALFADRIVVVRNGEVVVAYPVVAPVPRLAPDVAVVTERVAARLAS